MYVLVQYFADGSGKPFVSFVPVHKSDQRDKWVRSNEQVTRELFELVGDMSKGDRHQLYLISDSLERATPISGEVNRTKGV